MPGNLAIGLTLAATLCASPASPARPAGEGSKPVQAVYTLDRNMPHLDAAAFPLREPLNAIFAVPERGSIGTNSLDEAITVIDLSGGKARLREVRRRFKKYVSGGKMVFLPEFSRDTIGYTQTRGFLLFNVKTGEFRDQLIVRLLQLELQDVAVIDWEKRLFLFNVEFLPGMTTSPITELHLVDLAGDEPKDLARIEIKHKPQGVELGKTTFYFTKDGSALRLHALDERLSPVEHPLLRVYGGGVFTGEPELPIVHPTLPVALFATVGGDVKVWAASWRDREKPVVHPLFAKAYPSDFRYSPDGTEACDDAGETLRCNGDCSLARHGDGIVNASSGEKCDGGIPGGTSPDCQSLTCNANCTWSAHGDGIANPAAGEQCDGNNLGAGNGTNCESPFCNVDCTWSRHGDGILNLLAGEACDGGVPGGSSPNCQSASCNADCTISRHGDGIVNPLHDDEKCDGGVVGGMSTSCESLTCTDRCTLSSCGDTIVNRTAQEECDDGNTSADDDCKACKLTSCGDGIRNVSGPLHAEACDLGTARNGATSCSYGLTSCDGCAVDCQATLPTVAHYCGDGVPETGQLDASGGVHDELCDDTRSFACRTCATGTCAAVATAKARGRIEVRSTSVAEGTVITLGDQFMTFTIEIDMRNDGCKTSPAPLGCATVTDSTPELRQIAGAIRDEVTRLHGLGKIPLHLRSTTNDQYVKLEHDLEGVIGNSAITASPFDSGTLALTAMANGVGCGTGAPCATDADCVSGTCLAATDTTPAVCE
jgi:hypothetical protein